MVVAHVSEGGGLALPSSIGVPEELIEEQEGYMEPLLSAQIAGKSGVPGTSCPGHRGVL